MKILLTGAFGNIGTNTMEELIRRGHHVRGFDLRTHRNEEMANCLAGQIETVWGDLRRPDDVAAAVRDQDAVVHMAFVLPRLSSIGVASEEHPDWAREINVGGTRNLLEALRALPQPPRFIFISSVHVYGRTQDQPPPRTVSDPVRPVEHYAQHKVECEELVKASGLDWTILRLAAALPVRLLLDPGMFDVPLGNRIEYVHTRDVGLAIANALECPAVWGKTWLIGGGPRCQFYYRDLVARVLSATGVGMLPERAFATTPYGVDWLDTTESQRLLRYQQRTLDDYIRDTRAALGYRLHLIKTFRPTVRRWLLSKSPYFG